jgi:hypothetical protein
MYRVPGATHRSEAEQFNRQNSHRPPTDQSTVGRLINHLKETRSIADHCRSGRLNSITDEEPSIAVLAELINSLKNQRGS